MRKESDDIERRGKGIGEDDGGGGRRRSPDIGSDGVSGDGGARDRAAVSVREDRDLDAGICCGVFLIG